MGSWGRLSNELHEVVDVTSREAAAPSIARGPLPGLPFGNGRSYGDVCLNATGSLWSTRGLDRFIRFDPTTGLLECEAGVTLKEVIELLLPRGWFPPVTPGTQYATIGGAVANDVHGKNHHLFGSFGDHVDSLTLLRTDGRRIICGPEVETDWFRATVGGMGLTGLIDTVTFRLRPVAGEWIETQRRAFHDLDQFFELSAAATGTWEYTVSWIDCARLKNGEPRGIFFAGNHSPSESTAPRIVQRRVPFTPPVSLVNGLTLRAFNELYFRTNEIGAERSGSHYKSFFYPLDSVLDWNRLYGPNGFYQFQCVVPKAGQHQAIRDLLVAIAQSGAGSFLSVLKTFGDRVPAGLLSFPMSGTTLALDFPNHGLQTRELLTQLTAIVVAAGGRLYPAKDASMSGAVFKRGYPNWAAFEKFRDPGVSSGMSRRLFGK